MAVWTDGEVPFVPTPPEVVDRMLEMAQVKSGDVIYDLGSGDGRIIIRAAKRYGVKGVGIEIDADLVQKANDNAFKEKVDHLVEFRMQDALTVDVAAETGPGVTPTAWVLVVATVLTVAPIVVAVPAVTPVKLAV